MQVIFVSMQWINVCLERESRRSHVLFNPHTSRGNIPFSNNVELLEIIGFDSAPNFVDFEHLQSFYYFVGFFYLSIHSLMTDCCLALNEQFNSYIMVKTVTFWCNGDDEVRFVPDQKSETTFHV